MLAASVEGGIHKMRAYAWSVLMKAGNGEGKRYGGQ